jgi:DNA topoisomerase-2
LKYLNDDGTPVEPLFYAPIIPMILVNGSKGIGTGFSTDIMCYNPIQIIDYLVSKLGNAGFVNTTDFLPYYEGFNGTISKISDSKFLIKGRYEKLAADKIRVTELPVGFWTENFKELLEELIEPTAVSKDGKKQAPSIKDYDDMSRDTTIDFTVTFPKGKLEELEATNCDNNCNGVEKLLKLFTTNTNTNMRLFDSKDKLKKYETVEAIIDDYFETRYEMYQVRKDYMINDLTRELVLLSNKARYIKENLDGTIDLRKKNKALVSEMLKEKGYNMIDEDDEYKYLVKLPMDSVTEENVQKIFKEQENKAVELEVVKNTSANQMWTGELISLKKEYTGYLEERKRLMMGEDEDDNEIKISKKKVVVNKVKKVVSASSK